MKRLSRAIEFGLVPLSWLYGCVIRIRNFAFDRRLLIPEAIGVSVISVGNITAGGTGKTPVVAWLLEQLQEHGKSVGIVSRGYRGTERGPSRVPSSGTLDAASCFGDEPAWFASRFPKVPVFICGDRVSAVRAMLQEADVDVILADDGFQHRRLPRSMDIVLLDATEPRWHYRPLPLGRMREPFSSLSRASVILITKTNLANDQNQIRWLKKEIAKVFKKQVAQPLVIELESRILKLAQLGAMPFEQGSLALKDLKGESVLLVSAIGRPEGFKKLIQSESGAVIVDHMVFRDHHAFTEIDLANIEMRAKVTGAGRIILTEKDATKMASWNSKVPCFVARLEMTSSPARTSEELKDLYAAIDRALF
jgi:tetraacyldisaccharide 4'-kinase